MLFAKDEQGYKLVGMSHRSEIRVKNPTLVFHTQKMQAVAYINLVTMNTVKTGMMNLVKII